MENESESDEEEDTKKKTRTLSKRKELRKFENMTRQRIRARLERSSIVKHRPLRSRTQDFQRAFLVAETLSWRGVADRFIALYDDVAGRSAVAPRRAAA